MSGSASSRPRPTLLAPVFVVEFGSRFNNNNRRKKKRQDYNNSCKNWHVCDSLYHHIDAFSATLSSSFSFFLLIFLVILCSIGGGDDVCVNGSEIFTSSLPNSNNNGLPAFDVNDLKNLIEIFPEFREYVYKVVSSHVEKQQIQHQQYGSINGENVQATSTAAKAVAPLNMPSAGGYTVYDGGTSPNSRKDLFSYSSSQVKGYAPAVQKTDAMRNKHSYGWSHYDDYHNHHDHHDHHGYGYGPPTHFGWNSDHTHHETYKDPKFHYQVGYQLGKDLSCLFGLLGFKSIKDFSIYSFFSFLKKIKYVVLIGLAFKLGVLLSPIALPMLFPIILLAVIAKILPLLLIIVLLFKLLKTQLKLGIGRRDGETSSGDVIGATMNNFSNLLEGTNISRLWKSIDDVTQSVVESEDCVEKVICKMIQRKSDDGGVYNQTFSDDGDMDFDETGRSMLPVFSGRKGVISGLLSKAVDWIFPNQYRKFMDFSLEKIWECDKIRCSYIEKS